MRFDKYLKTLYRQIIGFVLIFSILAGLLFVEQIGFRAKPNTIENSLLDEDYWYSVKNDDAGRIATNASRCLVVFDEADESSGSLADNICYTLRSINVNVIRKSVIVNKLSDSDDEATEDASFEASNSADESPLNIDFFAYDDIIMCFSSISSAGINDENITEWVKQGGHLMLAGGIDESIDFKRWSSLLGIANENEIPTIYADSLQFNTNLLAGVEGREFSDDVISEEVLAVSLRSDCVVHISTSDESGCPLLWEHTFEKGAVIVCNTALMESKSDRGIIAAAYCRFYPVYVYPVINACVYCIDDCPSPIPAGYDKNILTQYGITINDYYSTVWMPAMQKLAEEHDIRFSTFAIQTYENDVEGPFNNTDNRKMASYYASLILNMGGEIGIHGYNHQPLVLDGYTFDEENTGYTYWTSILSMLNSIKAAIQYTESLTDELYVQSYVAPSNIISNEALQEMISQVENIRVYAGVYVGTSDQFIQEFEVLDNGVVFCPRLTADMQMEDSEWWVQINELNYHYIESNFIHPDDILDEDRSDGGDFKQMLEGYTNMINWNKRMGLRDTTISECGGSVQRYANINYSQIIDENSITLNIDGLIDTAYMMIRTNGKRIVSIDGGTINPLNDDIGILTVESPTVIIKTVDKK